jgi:hypothetical protein
MKPAENLEYYQTELQHQKLSKGYRVNRRNDCDVLKDWTDQVLNGSFAGLKHQLFWVACLGFMTQRTFGLAGSAAINWM